MITRLNTSNLNSLSGCFPFLRAPRDFDEWVFLITAAADDEEEEEDDDEGRLVTEKFCSEMESWLLGWTRT